MLDNIKTSLYYLGIALLFTHELDAVLNMEWRLLFHLRTLPDVAASSLFVALHLPLFFAFFYLGHHKSAKIQGGFRLIVSIFLVVHSGLHLNLSNHKMYQFTGVLSNLYIYGAAVCGITFVVLSSMRLRGDNA